MKSLFTRTNVCEKSEKNEFLCSYSLNFTFIQVVSLRHELIVRANVQHIHQHLRHCGGEMT